MDSLNDQTATTAAPKPFSYEITPRAAHVGGGWRLQLFEGAFEVGGGIHPVTEEVTSDEAYQEALDDGEAWLMSRGAAPAASGDEPNNWPDFIRACGYTEVAPGRFEKPKAAPASADNPSHDEILSLHRQLAAEKLRADQGWARAEAKSRECIELRERMAADNPSTAGAGSIDTREFQSLMGDIVDAVNDMETSKPFEIARRKLVEYIDGRLAAPVAQSTAGAAKPVGKVVETDIDVSVIDAVLPIGAAVYLAAPAAQAPAQVPTAAEVREQALEDAAQAVLTDRIERTVGDLNDRELSHNTAVSRAVTIIRALRTASKEGAQHG